MHRCAYRKRGRLRFLLDDIQRNYCCRFIIYIRRPKTTKQQQQNNNNNNKMTMATTTSTRAKEKTA
jgi:hypothetical protein